MHKGIHSSFSFGECLPPFNSESCVFPSAVKKVKIKMYITVILPVYFGCWMWFLNTKGRIQVEGVWNQDTLEPKRHEVTGGQSTSVFPNHTSMEEPLKHFFICWGKGFWARKRLRAGIIIQLLLNYCQENLFWRTYIQWKGLIIFIVFQGIFVIFMVLQNFKIFVYCFHDFLCKP